MPLGVGVALPRVGVAVPRVGVAVLCGVTATAGDILRKTRVDSGSARNGVRTRPRPAVPRPRVPLEPHPPTTDDESGV